MEDQGVGQPAWQAAAQSSADAARPAQAEVVEVVPPGAGNTEPEEEPGPALAELKGLLHELFVVSTGSVRRWGTQSLHTEAATLERCVRIFGAAGIRW